MSRRAIGYHSRCWLWYSTLDGGPFCLFGGYGNFVAVTEGNFAWLRVWVVGDVGAGVLFIEYGVEGGVGVDLAIEFAEVVHHGEPLEGECVGVAGVPFSAIEVALVEFEGVFGVVEALVHPHDAHPVVEVIAFVFFDHGFEVEFAVIGVAGEVEGAGVDREPVNAVDEFGVGGEPCSVGAFAAPDHSDDGGVVSFGEVFSFDVEPVLFDGVHFGGVEIDAEVAELFVVGGLAVKDEAIPGVHGF